MNANLLAQPARFDEWRQAVETQFRNGDSAGSAIAAVVILLGLILLAAWLSERQRRKAERVELGDDPGTVLHSLIAKLELPTGHRDFLQRFIRELRPMQAGILLLSESEFDRHASAWQNRPGAPSRGGSESDTIARIRARLFPHAGGGVVGAEHREASKH